MQRFDRLGIRNDDGQYVLHDDADKRISRLKSENAQLKKHMVESERDLKAASIVMVVMVIVGVCFAVVGATS